MAWQCRATFFVVVIRLLSIYLALAIGTPALAWGGMLVPGGIDRIGSSCCCGDSTCDDEPTEEPEFEKTCCCKPGPVTPGSAGSLRALPPEDAQVVPLLASPALTIKPEPVQPAHSRPRALNARAPPSNLPLLVQKTSILV